MSGQSGSGISVAFVEALGLKYLFSTLMGKVRWCSVPMLLSYVL